MLFNTPEYLGFFLVFIGFVALVFGLLQRYLTDSIAMSGLKA